MDISIWKNVTLTLNNPQRVGDVKQGTDILLDFFFYICSSYILQFKLEKIVRNTY